MINPGMVSTIIPVFNRALELRRAVASVLAQNYRPIEIVIVDDGSTDETSRAADDLAAAHSEVQTLHVTNRGPGQAREAGQKAAGGEFVQYLDSDDVLLPRRFEQMVAALRAQPDRAIAYSGVAHVDQSGLRIPCHWKRLLAGEETIFPHFLRGRLWETGMALIRREAVDRAGSWSNLRREEDWEYDCRFGAAGVSMLYVGEPLIQIQMGGSGLSRQPLDAASLRDRAAAETAILEHARAGGVDAHAPEMAFFARSLFHLARQCGAAGLVDESRRLFHLARQASGARVDFSLKLYGAVAKFAGWTTMGKLSAAVDRFRS